MSRSLWNPRTLRSRLLLVVLAAFVPSFITVALGAIQLRRHARDDAEGSALALARTVARQEQLQRGAVTRVIGALAHDSALIAAVSDPRRANACIGRLEGLVSRFAPFRSVAIRALDGSARCHIPAESSDAPDAALRASLATALRTSGFASTGYVFDTAADLAILHAAQPIVNARGEVVGVATLSMGADWIKRMIPDLHLDKSATLTILDTTGVVALRHPEGRAIEGRLLLPNSVLRKLVMHDGSAAQEGTGIDGTGRFYAYARLSRGFASPPQSVIVGIPQAVALAEANRQALRNLLVVLLLVPLALGSAYVLADRYVLRGIDQLADAAKRVERGEFGVPTGISQNEGELGELAHAFDQMTQSLDRRQREREGAANERRALEQQVQQAQRLDSLGRLAGGVAHDFNNLLTVITSYSDLLALTLTGEQRDEVEEIRRAARRAALLTRQLLSFSRRQEVERATVDLGGVVLDTDGMLRGLVSGAVVMELSAARRSAWVMGDVGQIEQVIVNLVVNARDAVGGKGRIGVNVRTLDATDARPAAAPSGALVVLEVQDDGQGMDDDTRARVFEPFFTTKPTGKGTGLGLSTVYGIVREMGGHIEVTSAPGAGAKFSVYLAAVPAGSPTTRTSLEFGAPATGWGVRILLVDDDDAVRIAAARTLRDAGYVVHEASGGAAALAQWDGLGGAVDMLVTDVVMPGMDGWALAGELRARRSGLPVLFCSGYTRDEGFVDRAGAAGMRLLEKPYATGALVEAVKTVLEEG
ncbi:MAG: hybrid sensor histidine kinase/response regulator [Gemmatimonadetes bacterium]|nr:hybrid sensor histidine kinase/response regulator [Gemmatimonadota bacterium]